MCLIQHVTWVVVAVPVRACCFRSRGEGAEPGGITGVPGLLIIDPL